jgi:outer membrane protein assembly factor BamB
MKATLANTCLATAIAILAASTAWPQTADPEGTILLAGLESKAGLQLTWSKSCVLSRIEINADRRYISQGAASLHLTAQSGDKAGTSYYAGVMIPLEPADADARTILLDCWTSTPQATQAVYVRLYGPDRKIVASWNHWQSPFQRGPQLQIALNQGQGRQGFTWEEKMAAGRPANPISAVEIVIGTRAAGARFDIYLDNLRMTDERHRPFTAVSRAKKLFPDTVLVEGGQGRAVVVVPPDPAYRALAEKIARRVEELSGARLAIISPEAATPRELARVNSIVLGNVCNNRALLPLYALLYTPVDDFFPSADGYLVHSVHDPWGTGRNVIVVGASTAAGAARAVDALLATCRRDPDLVLPKLTLYQCDAQQTQAMEAGNKRLSDADIARQVELAKQDFARGGHRSVADRMARLGWEYVRWGNEMRAKLYKELALAWYASYAAKPPIYGGPWGMDMDFHLMEILPAWDLLEESPALGDEDRLRVTKVLYEFVTTDVVHKASGALHSTKVRHNHTTFPALGLFFAGNYFKNGYHALEADQWLEIAQACFTLQAQAAKPYENCNGYGWLVPYHTMRYALATLDFRYFDNGNVRREADSAILTMDNLGYQVPFGDTGSYQCWWTEIPFLRGAAFFHRDGRYAWALEKKAAAHRDQALYQYACKVEAQEPTDLLGVRALPLDRMYWESLNGPATIPLEKAVDKVVMRASFDPSRQYLLLDGLSNGGHMHYDGNSISRITDRGRIWLADNDYIRSLPKFHNSVLVFKDGQAATIPPYCELEAVADGRQFGAAQTTVRNYAGVDWQRTILWNKERFFLVLDDLAAREPADYDFHCLWHTVGKAELTGAGLAVAQQGPRMFIKNGPGADLHLSDNIELGKNWNGYAFAEPVVHSLRQVRSARLAAGGHAGFANLIYTTGEESPREYSIGGQDHRQVTVTGSGETLVAGIGQPGQPREIVPGLRIAARAFLVGPRAAFAADARSFCWRNFALQADRPVQLELCDGQIQVGCTSATELTISAAGREPTWKGPVRRTRSAQGTWVAELNAGQSSVAFETPLVLSDWEKAIDSTRRQTQASGPTAAPTAKLRAGKVLWSFRPPSAPVPPAKAAATGKDVDRLLSITAGDLDGDGRDEVLAGSAKNNLWCLDAGGRPRWKFAAAGPITTTVVARLDRSKQKTAVAGSEDCKVYALTPEGRLRWSFEMPYYKAAGRVRVLLAADINADGYDEIIAGGDNWRYYALDRGGRELWHYESVHPSSAAAVADLDGDGKLETLCGTVYYWWHCAGPDGTRRWTFSAKGPHATVALAANLEGKGPRAAVFGSEDGTLHVLDHRGRLLWEQNVGDEVTGALAIDLDGDGRDEIVATSMAFSVIALDGSGKRRWRTNLGAPILSLAAADLDGHGRKMLIAGCENGAIFVLDCAGRSIGRFRAPGAVLALVPAQLKPGPRRQILARTLDGSVTAIEW